MRKCVKVVYDLYCREDLTKANMIHNDTMVIPLKLSSNSILDQIPEDVDVVDIISDKILVNTDKKGLTEFRYTTSVMELKDNIDSLCLSGKLFINYIKNEPDDKVVVKKDEVMGRLEYTIYDETFRDTLKVKRLSDLAILPTRGSNYSAGLDLYATERVLIQTNQTKLIHTQLAIEIPEGYFGGIYARSGIGIKLGLAPGNCVGVIDSDYRGEIIIGLYNHSDTYQIIEPGTRVAQLIIQPYNHMDVEEVDELSDTVRDTGGFGSTGK